MDENQVENSPPAYGRAASKPVSAGAVFAQGAARLPQPGSPGVVDLSREIDLPASPSASTRRWLAYPAYKPSSIPWLGEIPAHWDTRRLKYVAPQNTVKLNEKPAGAIYLGLEHVESGTGRLLLDDPVESVDSAVVVFEKGDVLFGKLRPYLAKVVCVDFDGVATSEIVVLRPHSDVAYNRYLFYTLLTDGLIRQVSSLTYGTRMPRASPEQIGNIQVPLPPLSEQRAIAAFLDRETAKIDALVAKKERLIELLEEKRTALISHMVTKGLDPTAPMKDSGVSWLGKVPESWEVRRLKYTTPEITVGIVVTPAKYYVDIGVPCLRSLNIKEGRIQDTDLVFISDESNNLHHKSKIFKGDLVTVRSGQPGSTAVVDDRFDGTNCIDLIIIRRTAQFDSAYMAYLANSEFARAQFAFGSGGAIQQHFNIETTKNLLALLPPVTEQREIAAYLDRETARLDKLVSTVQRATERLKEHRAALIAAAVTGKIDVR